MSGYGRFFPECSWRIANEALAAKPMEADGCLIHRPSGRNGSNLLYGNFYNLDLPLSKPKDEEKEGFTPLPPHFVTIHAPLFYYII